MAERKTELIKDNGTISEDDYKIVSDRVIIEIVHAFREIIIKFIDSKYQKST